VDPSVPIYSRNLHSLIPRQSRLYAQGILHHVMALLLEIFNKYVNFIHGMADYQKDPAKGVENCTSKIKGGSP